MSVSVLLKHLSFWTLLAVWPSFATAFVIVVKNKSDSPVIPWIQQAGGELEANDPAGAVPSKGERVYDNASPWLRSDLMGVKQNDQRTISLLFVKEAKMVDCGQVDFVNGTVLTATEDKGSCQQTSMDQVTETAGYKKRKPDETLSSAWVVAPIMDADDQAHGCGEPGISVVKRYYAQGPTDIVWEVVSNKESTLKVQVAKHKDSGIEEVAEVHFLGYVDNQCGVFIMNSAAGCEDDEYTFLKFEYSEASSGIDLKPPPSTGSYSGVVKIRELKWDERTVLDEFYLNVEIEVP